LKVGYVTGSVSRSAGGLYQTVRRLAEEMGNLDGVLVEVFGLADQFTEADRSAWAGISLRACAVRGPRSFGYAPALRGLLDGAAPDILHTNGIWMYPSLASQRWTRGARKPYIVSPHGMLRAEALRIKYWKKCIAGWLYQNGALRRAACLHALCRAEAEDIRRYGLTNPVCVVSNGVDLPARAGATAVAAYSGTPSHARTLLYLGRLHRIKGLLHLLQGWKLARQQARPLREWRLVIAGWDDGGHQQELDRLCREQHIEAVSFVGPQFGSDKDAVFRGADAFVLPSLSEALPVAVLEAWSYGLPVVMTPECNLPEGFQAGAAIRVETEPGSIARGLVELVEMRDAQRREMGERGRRLVEEKFSWRKIARQMKEVYEWVLGGGPRPTDVDII